MDSLLGHSRVLLANESHPFRLPHLVDDLQHPLPVGRKLNLELIAHAAIVDEVDVRTVLTRLRRRS